jgi:hypothetical protein
MSTGPRQNIDILAGICAFLFPGAGHMLRKQTRRGVLASVGVLGLFFGGLFMGGIDVIDRKEDKWWFMGQAIVGPIAFGINAVHQSAFKAYEVPSYLLLPGSALEEQRFALMSPRSLFPGEGRRVVDLTIKSPSGQTTQTRIPVIVEATNGDERPSIKSLGRMNELGMLSATIAGMLNFIIILDALFPGRPRSGGANP